MSKRNTGYKNGRVRDLALSSSAEPLNAMSESISGDFQTKPVLQSRRSLNPGTGGSRISVVVPVVALDGTPLMPCTPAKAEKLLSGGVAKKCWNKLGMFYIQMLGETSKQVQIVALALDPGSKYEAVVIATKKQILTAAMLELPVGVARKMENRSIMRRGRRSRNCRRRPCRFDNRTRPEGWIAPSQKTKVNFKIKVLGELFRIYPLNQRNAIEDIRFNHYKKSWGKQFSTAEIGKTMLYDWLKQRAELVLYEGHETNKMRKKLGLKKISSKSKRCPESHVTDAIALCDLLLGTTHTDIPEFYVISLPTLRRRSLHYQNPAKGNVRRVHGGTTALGIKKNTVVFYKGKLARTGGSTNGRISLHDMSVDCKRFTQNAKVEDLTFLFRQTIFSERIENVSSHE